MISRPAITMIKIAFAQPSVFAFFLRAQLVIVVAAALSCSRPAATPTSPSLGTEPPIGLSALIERPPADDTAPARNPFATLDVTFPPRDQSLRFRQELEAYYRDVIGRPASASFVDLEGTIVWTQEYLRYRVNGCNHATATARVLAIIDGGATQPVCSTVSTPFPPRNEPFQFRQDLEVKYRDTLRRGPTLTFVDVEGDIVWTQEYFRYRTMSCTDAQASARVIEQVRGGPPASTCSGLCGITVSEPVVSFNELGDSRSVTITTSAGCSWTATSDSPWLTIISGSSGNGTGTLRYQVAPMTTPGTRNGVITIGDQMVRVRQVNDPISASFQMLQGGSPTGACNLGGSGASNCSLDGTASRGAISSYQWSTTQFRSVGGNVSRSYSGAVVNLGSITCTVNGNSQERFDVTLTVVDSSGRTATSSQSLSFARAGCGT
jgi:hypothetical protein